jgi:hypothetical protein
MALSDILKKYGDSSVTEGIMIPSAGVKSVSTEQEVYDSATDGIMTVNQEKYIGPSSTIVYGNEDDSYNRMLRQIEQNELPQFDQSTFPAVGTGIMQPSTPVTQPVDTTPVEQPKVDPCPPGYKLIDGVCQPIAQPQQDRGGDRQTFTGPKITNGIIEGFEDLSLQGPDVRTGAFYERLSPEMKAEYDKALTYGRGIQVKFGPDGQPERIVAHSPTLSELVGDAARAIGDIIENTNLINVVSKVLGSDEKPETKETTTDTETTTQTTIPALTIEDFGGIDNISETVTNFSNNFGTLQNSLINTQERLKSAQQALVDEETKSFTPSMIRETKESIGKQEGLKSTIINIENDERRIKRQLKAQEDKIQSELNQSSESDFVVGSGDSKKTFTVHRDANNKILGYSNKGSSAVNMAGMQPIGPGQRIKNPSPTVKQRLDRAREQYGTLATRGK